MKDDFISTFESLIEVMNEHELHASLDFFADNAIVMVPPTIPGERNLFKGKDEIAEWLEMIFSENLHVGNLHEFRVEGNSISVDHNVHLDRFASLGMDTVSGTCRVSFEKGDIISFVGKLDDESLKRLDEVRLGATRASGA